MFRRLAVTVTRLATTSNLYRTAKVLNSYPTNQQRLIHFTSIELKKKKPVKRYDDDDDGEDKKGKQDDDDEDDYRRVKPEDDGLPKDYVEKSISVATMRLSSVMHRCLKNVSNSDVEKAIHDSRFKLNDTIAKKPSVTVLPGDQIDYLRGAYEDNLALNRCDRVLIVSYELKMSTGNYAVQVRQWDGLLVAGEWKPTKDGGADGSRSEPIDDDDEMVVMETKKKKKSSGVENVASKAPARPHHQKDRR